MKRLQVGIMLSGLVVLASCSTDTATKDAATTEASESITADTAEALAQDTTGTAGVATTAVADSAMQVVVALTLHALGDTPANMRYDQDTLEATAGALVKLELVNKALTMPMVHNVVITAPGAYKAVALAAEQVGASGNYIPKGEAVLAASPMALPGQTILLEFTAPEKAGVYDFVCTYPGHWQRMHGQLRVK